MKNLPTLQDLFNNSVFKIPNYQRGYSWETQQRTDLLEDLELINNKGHYTGTIVLKENSSVKGLGKIYNKFDIVDGQQRFTSILILLDSIAKELRRLKNEEAVEIADGIISIYIKEKMLGGGYIYKLELDEENDDYFKSAIIEDDTGINRKIKSHQNLYNAKNEFQFYLDQQKEQVEDYFDYLCSMIEKITQSLIFTLYKVEDNAEVGVIFEVMNDRGKPLSELEKVKNYLIYLTSKSSKDEIAVENLVKKINNYWKEILENLAIARLTRNDDEDRFLRLNYIINFYSDIKVKKIKGRRISKTSQLTNIYKRLKSYFKELERNGEFEKCYNEIDRYVTSLKNTSIKLRDINNPEFEFAFQNIPDEFKDNIKNICLQVGRLDIRSNILVLLVSIYEKFIDKPDKIIELMRLCEAFAFRVYYMAGWRSYSGQDRLYSISCDIYKGRMNYREVINEIHDLTTDYAPSSNIKEYLTYYSNYYDWNGLKYFLFEYERFKCLKEINKEPKLTWEHLKHEKRQDSIEHILPQTIAKVEYWNEKFDGTEHEENIGRLGNLTLTTGSENSKLSNHDFETKKKIYKDSVWHINQEIANYNEWTIEMIDKRENDLIKFAIERWGL